MPRQVQTLLFTDLVGSTDRLRRLGDVAWADLLRRHHSAIRAVLAAHRGHEVDTAGDGFLARFDSPTAAVHAAAAALRRVTALGLQMRVGLHTGEVELNAARPSGMGVHLAARVMAVAGPDEVLVSATLRELVTGSGLRFGDRGVHVLKGFIEPWRLFALDLDSVPGPAGTRPDREPGAPGGWQVPLAAQIVADTSAPTPMVGRQAECERITAARTATGRRLVLVSGEPGIGKSRLISEVARTAFDGGAVVLHGRCSEGMRVTCRPWVEALGHLVAHAGDDVLAALDAGRLADLARLLPGSQAGLLDGGEVETYQLFQVVAALIGSVASARPVVLVLDDLHWADDTTLLLLRHVVAASSALPLLVLAAYRDSDLTPQHPLTAALAGLYREAGVERVPLTGLDDAGIRALIGSVAGPDVDGSEPAVAALTELAGTIRQETAGNPFFAVEMLRRLLESGLLHRAGDGGWRLSEGVDAVALPESVRAVALERVARLGDEPGRVLGVASVLGRAFDVGVLAAVLDEPEDAVLDHLDGAVAAGLVHEVPGDADRYAFTHVVVRQALHEGLGAARRRRWRRRMADVVERPGEAAPIAAGTDDEVAGAQALARFTLAAVDRTLHGGSAPAVGHALDLLERTAPEELDRRLPGLLAHPEERVRLDVLTRIEQRELVELIDVVAARVPYEGSAVVRGASLGLVAALGGPDTVLRVAPAIAEGGPVRTGVLAGLLRSGGIEAVVVAGPPLLALLHSSDPGDRCDAARVLGGGGGALHRPLLSLVADDVPDVAREALRAAAAVDHPRLWPAVVATLARTELRGAAQRALEIGGAAALDAVTVALRSAPEPALAVAMLDTCARLGSQAAPVVLSCLGWALDVPQRRVGDAAVGTLLRLGAGVDADADLVVDRISRDLDAAAELVADRHALAGLTPSRAVAALAAACHDLQQRIGRGLVRRWALLQEPSAAARLLADQPPSRAAIEAGTGPRDVAAELAAVVTAPDIGALVARLATPPTTVTEAMHRLLSVGHRDDPLLAGLVLHAAADARPDLLAGLAARVDSRAAPLLVDTARMLRTDRKDDTAMTPVERVLALRDCDVFAEADGESLTALAEQATAHQPESGAVLFSRGDRPDALHLLVGAVVELFDGGRTRLLGPGELAGELAICDREPHTATAVVREPGAVLTIPAPAVEELLATSPGVARELLRRLARRARAAESGVGATDDVMASILDRLADS